MEIVYSRKIQTDTKNVFCKDKVGGVTLIKNTVLLIIHHHIFTLICLENHCFPILHQIDI